MGLAHDEMKHIIFLFCIATIDVFFVHINKTLQLCDNKNLIMVAGGEGLTAKNKTKKHKQKTKKTKP